MSEAPKGDHLTLKDGRWQVTHTEQKPAKSELSYNPYRQDMSRACAVCGAPPHAFCVPSMHREPRP